jgi:hypothetical protein
MGWGHGTNAEGREVGYNVAATCDQPGCSAAIDRGLAYVCGGMHDGGEHGCGKYFCEEHLFGGAPAQLCKACLDRYMNDHEHEWKYHRNPDTPDGPGDVECYCDVCGMPHPGSGEYPTVDVPPGPVPDLPPYEG